MFAENLLIARKNKGYSQEALAEKMHVVRQTISKWEKGLSVPDAQMLLQLSEVLEVSVSELLGAPIEKTDKPDEIAVQLAQINEQLAIKNRRARRIWRIIGGVVIGYIVIMMVMLFLFSARTNVREHTVTEAETVEIIP